MNWTRDEFDAAIRRQSGKEVFQDNTQLRRNTGASSEQAPAKYRNSRKEIDGIVFDSCKEAKVYLSLKWREKAGEISELRLQPHYLLQEAFRDAQGKKHRKIEYYGDFAYLEYKEVQPGRFDFVETCVEVKGYDTPTWRLKCKLFLAKFPHIRLEVIR